jgi:hypothetical protein
MTMTIKLYVFSFSLFFLLATSLAQPADPWTPAQLMSPADLAARIDSARTPLLLDLSHNIKTNWIDHGYPVKEEGGHAR